MNSWIYFFSNSSNKLIVRFYSENFLNDPNKTEIEEAKQQVARWQKKFNVWLSSARSWYRYDDFLKCLERLAKNIEATVHLIDGLRPLFDHRFSNNRKNHVPSKEQFFQHLNSDIDLMRKNAAEDQTMAFHYKTIDDVYDLPILSSPRFKFERKTRVIYEFTSYLTMYYQIAFPFHGDSLDSSEECLSADELPPFFRQNANVH